MQNTTPVSNSLESIHSDELLLVSGGCGGKCGGGRIKNIQKFIFNMAAPQQAPAFDPSQLAQQQQLQQPQYSQLPQMSQPQFQQPMGGGYGPYVSTNVSFGQQAQPTA